MLPNRKSPTHTPSSTSSNHLSHDETRSSANPSRTDDQQIKRTSCQNLPNTILTSHQGVNRSTDYLNRGAALYDLVADRLDDLVSLMDEEAFVGNEHDVEVTYYHSQPSPFSQSAAQTTTRGGLKKASLPAGKGIANRSIDLPGINTSNVFAKAAMYANSRLPPELAPLRVYIATWPLISLAARYSLDIYRRQRGAESGLFVEADWHVGTKAMVIGSVPVDDKNAVVLAIRGTQTFMDWAVNLDTATVSPSGFLDDAGNLCHAGFLDVARKMIKPVALRLKQIPEVCSGRPSSSLLITGHSAGGAVASLLYSHMLSRTIKSELHDLAVCFKRVHCVTFGAPPVSLLPLSKPADQEIELRKSMFLSFINEGDPVTRADRSYVFSLLKLYRSQPPKVAIPAPITPHGSLTTTSKVKKLGEGFLKVRPNKGSKPPKPPSAADRPSSNAVWKVPSITLSNAGRLVLLRTRLNGPDEDVKALITTDEQLRQVVFGDPLMHQMKLYSRRVRILAEKAISGR